MPRVFCLRFFCGLRMKTWFAAPQDGQAVALLQREEKKDPLRLRSADTSPGGPGEAEEKIREDEDEGEGVGREVGSPHPGPLPSEWEREEEKTCRSRRRRLLGTQIREDMPNKTVNT